MIKNYLIKNGFPVGTIGNKLREERKNAHSRWIFRAVYLYCVLDHYDPYLVLRRKEGEHRA